MDYVFYDFAQARCRLEFQDTPAQQSESVSMQVARFLFTHLDSYGDPIDDIVRCLEYASVPGCGQGGAVLLARDPQANNAVVAAVVFNKTGMTRYIPENILVYIAVHRDYRGQGLGAELIRRSLEQVAGSIALHVEADNPAKFLYQKLGFENKYLEMRLQR